MMLDWLPENVSTYGGDIDRLLSLIYYIVGAWFLLTESILFYFLFRYWHRPGKKAGYAPGNTLRQLSWVLVPVVLILGLDLYIDVVGAEVWKTVKLEVPETDQTVRIVGRQFKWKFVYPGKDEEARTDDDFEMWSQLHVPVNTVVRFDLESEDVIHSLWLPHLRLKQDAVPGRTIVGWFEATKVGEYPLACAELCGMGHGTMKATLYVHSEADYAKWLAEQVDQGDSF